MVDRELRLDLDLFTRGGLEILRAIERQQYDVLASRPSIGKATKMALAARAISGKLLPSFRLQRGARVKDLDEAYAVCRSTCAKRQRISTMRSRSS